MGVGPGLAPCKDIGLLLYVFINKCIYEQNIYIYIYGKVHLMSGLSTGGGSPELRICIIATCVFMHLRCVFYHVFYIIYAFYMYLHSVSI